MKISFQKAVNVFFVGLLAILGFSSCDAPKKYGPEPAENMFENAPIDPTEEISQTSRN